MGQLQQFLQLLSENSAGLVVLAALVSAVCTLVIAWFSIGMAKIYRLEKSRERAEMARLSVFLVKSAAESARFAKVARMGTFEEECPRPLLTWHQAFEPQVKRLLHLASKAPPEAMAFLHIAGTQMESLRGFAQKYGGGSLDAVQQERISQVVESIEGLLLKANEGIPRRHRRFGPPFRKKEYGKHLDAAAAWTKKKYPEGLPR
jgi:hypothetical protein